MRRSQKFKNYIVDLGINFLDRKFVNLFIWLMFISLSVAYFTVEREKLVYYIVSTAINQVFTFILFGTGILAILNIYLFKKFPFILDEFKLRKHKDYFRKEAFIFQVFIKWQIEIATKPIGFNSLGKEILIQDFILNEIDFFERNLVNLIDEIYENLYYDSSYNSSHICKRLKEIFLIERLEFKDLKTELFAKRFTIDSTISITQDKRKEILTVIPGVIIQKYTNSCADFNIFLWNSIDEIDRQKLSKYETLQHFYSDLVKCIFSYKDNLLPNFVNEFNGDLAAYHLLFDGVPLVAKDHQIYKENNNFLCPLRNPNETK